MNGRPCFWYICKSYNSIKILLKLINLINDKGLPTTSKSPVTMMVWNDGASADTSQLYLPLVVGDTLLSVSWLSLEAERYNYIIFKTHSLKIVHSIFGDI